jgi:sensor domain CHASE-containing protein
MPATPPTLDLVTLSVVDFIDREVAHLDRVCSLQFDLAAKAVALNHIETLRRLDELNHAHAQNMVDKQDFLPRQMFEQFANENAKWRETVTKAISESAGANRTLVVVMGFLFTALSIALRLWK